ncbi:MAG: hypothetical protein K8S98_14625 [Planctomycetes bacterium]|nr:hypothetical protein [Planctomycetota bacterium]
MRVERAALALSVGLCASACIAPSVVASSGRAVAVEEVALEWRAASVADVNGFFESEHIDGDVAASLLRVNYYFAADGYYSGAALTVGAAHPEYQTLSGTWKLDANGLVLDEGEPVECAAAGERLRLATPEGTLVLKRGALE